MPPPVFSRISEYPSHYAEVTPLADAIVDDRETLDWMTFERRIITCASMLIGRGIASGDRVAILADPGVDYLVMFMASARIGAIWQGLNPRQTAAEIAYLVSDAGSKLVFVASEYANSLSAIGGELSRRDYETTLETLPAIGIHDLPDRCDSAVTAELLAREKSIDATAPCLLVYTSGSTGSPKGALLSHQAVVSSALMQCQYWWAEPFRILNNLPINHIGGAVQISCQGIVAGGANVMMSHFDPESLVHRVSASGVTVMHQVPMMYQKIVDSRAYASLGLRSVQTLIWSGGAASEQLIEALRETGSSLFTSYGCTEAGGEVLYMPPGSSTTALAAFVGTPPEGVACRIAPSSGEIQVKAETLFSGYLGRDEASNAALTDDGWLKTGDCAEQDAETGLWRIVGRLKDMYKSGGYNIYPREVEVAMETHPLVAMAAVFGVPDALYGERGIAYVLLEKEATLSDDEIREHCRQYLAGYKIPREIYPNQHLPVLPIGKPDKAQLKKDYLAHNPQ